MVHVKNKPNRAFKWVTLASFMMLTGFLVLSFSEDEGVEKEFFERFQDDYSIYSIKLPDSLFFAGESVPVDFYDVREDLDRELLVNTYWQSHTLLYIKRANKYFPLIEDILEKNGVPEDFKYLPLIESDMTHVVSPSGAVGFWQLMKGTARDYGLEVNDEVDERYHLEKSTQAACDYLREAYEKFGSWTLAAASFNVGRSAIARQLEIQNTDNYYDLLLNTETGRYIYRLLAVKLILENPDKYGFHVRNEDLYYPITTEKVKLDSSVESFADYAKQHNLNYKELKSFNRWLRKPHLHNRNKKTYFIKVPVEETYRDYQNHFQNENKEVD